MIRHSAADHTIAVGRDTFPVIDEGEGPPVLFLHGALTDHRIWLPHCASLGSRFRCLALTQRYHGTQEWRGDGPGYGIATHAADLNRIVDALGLGAVAVVAWSYAGHVALHAAGLCPDHFSRIVLFEPNVRTLALDEQDSVAVERDAWATFGPIFEAVAQNDLRAAARALIDGSGGVGHFDALGAERQAVYLDNAHTLPLLLAQEAPPPTTREDLARLPMPVHVTWGARSRPVTKLPARALAGRFPASLHREIPGAGHLWPEEDPAAFGRMLTDLLGSDA